MAGSANHRDADDDARERAISDRLTELGRRLDETKAQRTAHDERSKGNPGALALAIRAVSELIAAILVGGVIGWGLDWWLGTSPVLLSLFFLFGFAAGVVNVVRATKQRGFGAAGSEENGQ